MDALNPTALMKAAVLVEPGRFEIRQAPLPQPGPGEVRVRLQGSGICASNIPVFEGREWFDYPLAPGEPGHEGWGVVDALGEGVQGPSVGTAVAALSFKAYAQYDVAAANALVPLPTQLRNVPFPGEALGCVMNIFRRADIRPGQIVAVIGVGFIGAALTQLISRAGARVIAISRSASSQALGLQCGAWQSTPLDEHQAIIDRVGAWTLGRLCDRVIECTGKAWPLDLAGELTTVGGKLVIAGFHQDGPRQVNVQLWNWRGIDVINAHERDPAVAVEGLHQAVRAVVDQRLHLDLLLSHRYPLERIGEALTAVCQRPHGFTKAVVLMEDAHDLA